MNDYLDYLSHHGVKGMKWGVRRDRSKNRVKRAARTVVGQEVSRHKTLQERRKEVPSLSNQELQSRITRLRLEQQYDDLLRSSNINLGKSYLKDAVDYTKTLQAITGNTSNTMNNIDKIGKRTYRYGQSAKRTGKKIKTKVNAKMRKEG